MASGTSFFFISAVLMTLAAADQQQPVRRRAGEDVTFQFGVPQLKEADWVVWSNDSGDVLAKLIEKDLFRASERFQLDAETGALTIKNLSESDTGSYKGQIINGNSIQRGFNLTVDGLVSSQAAASPGWTHWLALAASLCSSVYF